MARRCRRNTPADRALAREAARAVALASRRPVAICGIPTAPDLGLEARRPAPPVA